MLDRGLHPDRADEVGALMGVWREEDGCWIGWTNAGQRTGHYAEKVDAIRALLNPKNSPEVDHP